MTEKLSDRLWRILNDATLGDALSVSQLCAIDEARVLAKRAEDAPVGQLLGMVVYIESEPPSRFEGKRVRLVMEGEP